MKKTCYAINNKELEIMMCEILENNNDVWEIMKY